jgi:hypothetical protein
VLVPCGRCARRQLFSALGSLAALGDPAGLARGLAQGASDAVSAPLAGLVRAAATGDLTELTRGLQRGTQSFATHTVGGLAKSAALFSASVATAGSALSYDKEYKRRRAARRADGGSAHSGPPFGAGGGSSRGLGSAGSAAVGGVLDGLAGLVKVSGASF